MINLHFKQYILVCSLFIAVAAQDDHDHEEHPLTTAQMWGFGMLAGFGVSLIGLFAALFVIAIKQCVEDNNFKIFLNLLYSLGCGALVGDAMVHILPQAYKSEAVYSTFVALIFIGAITIFIIIQRAFVACGISHQHWEGAEDEHESHQHQGSNKIHDSKPKVGVESDQRTPEIEGIVEIKTINKTKQLPQSSSTLINQNRQKNQTPEGCLDKMKGKGAAGYLNLISSFIHNFFDGLAVGTAFASREKDQYVAVIIAVFAHEIPREMGDVGILMKNKFDSCQTIFWNALINMISLVGVAIGLALGNIGDAVQQYVMTFVAGNFIYIGADIWRHLLKHKRACLNFTQFMFFSVGVGAMYLVLLAQNSSGHNH